MTHPLTVPSWSGYYRCWLATTGFVS